MSISATLIRVDLFCLLRVLHTLLMYSFILYLKKNVTSLKLPISWHVAFFMNTHPDTIDLRIYLLTSEHFTQFLVSFDRFWPFFGLILEIIHILGLFFVVKLK